MPTASTAGQSITGQGATGAATVGPATTTSQAQVKAGKY